MYFVTKNSDQCLFMTDQSVMTRITSISKNSKQCLLIKDQEDDV